MDLNENEMMKAVQYAMDDLMREIAGPECDKIVTQMADMLSNHKNGTLMAVAVVVASLATKGASDTIIDVESAALACLVRSISRKQRNAEAPADAPKKQNNVLIVGGGFHVPPSNS